MTYASRFLLLGVALTLAGCPGEKSKTPTAKGDKSPTQSTQNSNCRDNLSNALSSADPERLEINADIESTVNVMDDWLSSCAKMTPLSDESLKELKPLFSEDALQNLQRERFTRRDINQIRISKLLSEIATHATAEADSDLARAVALFEYVTRNVILYQDTQDLPLTIYEVLLFGRGSQLQQAWVFAELLRQLKIDSVLLTSPEGLDNGFVSSVLIESEIYLFDFSLGTPVPGQDSAEKTIVARPATLKEVTQQPELIVSLRSLGSNIPSAEELRQPVVLLVLDSSLASARMESLNQELAGEKFVIHENLLDRGDDKGLISRVVAAGKGFWTRKQLQSWDLPEQHTNAFWSIAENSRAAQALVARKISFNAPAEIIVSPRDESNPNAPPPTVQLGQLSRRHWSTRIAQLEGLDSEVVRSYGAIRLSNVSLRKTFPGAAQNPQFDMVLRMHDVAAEDAQFWIGVTQLNAGQLTASRSTFKDYLTRFPAGRWSDAAHLLRGKIFIEQDNIESAVTELQQVSEISPLFNSARFLLARIGTPESQESQAAQIDSTQGDSDNPLVAPKPAAE